MPVHVKGTRSKIAQICKGRLALGPYANGPTTPAPPKLLTPRKYEFELITALDLARHAVPQTRLGTALGDSEGRSGWQRKSVIWVLEESQRIIDFQPAQVFH